MIAFCRLSQKSLGGGESETANSLSNKSHSPYKAGSFIFSLHSNQKITADVLTIQYNRRFFYTYKNIF